jgi:AcrR family transcriptional regulator
MLVELKLIVACRKIRDSNGHMKANIKSDARRSYKQGARAEAAEATGRRILDAFVTLNQAHWFDEVTLDAVAQEAGVTVQTVVRRFGGKEGLLEASAEHIEEAVRERRSRKAGDIDYSIDALTRDYEMAGDLYVRTLAQEDRYPAMRRVTEFGRMDHRRWVREVFAPWLDRLSGKARTACEDALVVAADVYVWKLMRRDMKRSAAEYKQLVKRMIETALAAGDQKARETKS